MVIWMMPGKELIANGRNREEEDTLWLSVKRDFKQKKNFWRSWRFLEDPEDFLKRYLKNSFWKTEEDTEEKKIRDQNKREI